jgi:hypothetical protein
MYNNGHSPFPNGHKYRIRSGVTVTGYATAVAAGQRQRFYSGVEIFKWYYLSSPSQIPLPVRPGIDLELGGLVFHVVVECPQPSFISDLSGQPKPLPFGWLFIFTNMLLALTLNGDVDKFALHHQHHTALYLHLFSLPYLATSIADVITSACRVLSFEHENRCCLYGTFNKRTLP